MANLVKRTSQKLLIKTKNISIDPSRRKHITDEDLVLMQDKISSQVKLNERTSCAVRTENLIVK